MRKLLYIFICSGALLSAQSLTSSGGVQIVTSAPSTAANGCTVGQSNEIVASTGALYTCEGATVGGLGTWTLFNVSLSGAVTGSSGTTSLRDFCSIKDAQFNGGAVGNNSTDDSIAINEATAACLWVLVPPPTSKYKMTVPLLVKSGTQLIGTTGPTTSGGSTIAFYGDGPGISGSFAPEGNYVSGGSLAGSGTCTATFTGSGGGSATLTVSAGVATTALSSFVGGVYNPAPTTATLSGGTGSAVCSGTATVFIYAPGGGTRNISIKNLYLEDDRTSPTFGDAIILDAGTDADANVEIMSNHTYKWFNSLTLTRTLQTWIMGNRFDIPSLNGSNQTGSSTSTHYIGNYVDAPGWDCYNIQSLNYSLYAANACDSAGRDGYHMDSTNRNTAVSFIATGLEGAARFGFIVEGQRLSFVSTSCFVNQYSGTVNTTGTTTVTLATGTNFPLTIAGTNIIIAGTPYMISSVTDATHLVTSTTVATQTGAAFTIGNHCYHIDNASQTIMSGPYARYGDYGLYNANTGALQSTYKGTPLVTISGFLSDNNNVAQVYDPNSVMSFTDTFNGHALHVGIPGTPTSCGTSPSLVAGSVDQIGTINIGSGTVSSCTLPFSFSTAFTNAPSCTGTANSSNAIYVSAVSVSSVTFSTVGGGSIGSGKLYYKCN